MLILRRSKGSLPTALAVVLMLSCLDSTWVRATTTTLQGEQNVPLKEQQEACRLEMSADGDTKECLENTANASTSTSSALIEQEEEIVRDLIAWIRANGGTIDKRQKVNRARSGNPASPIQVWATDFIPRGTVLTRVPWDIILSPSDPEDTDLCSLVHVTKKELKHYRQVGNASKYAPYMRLLDSFSQHMVLPEGWSVEGKRLLGKILGDDLPPRQLNDHLAWFETVCGGEDAENETIGAEATLLVIGYRSNGFLTPSRESFQETMMPFFDLYSHRNGKYYNTHLLQTEAGKDIVITASRDIQKGEPIHGSVGLGAPVGTPRLFKDGGFVEQLPRQFAFDLRDSEGYEHSMMFDLEEPEFVQDASADDGDRQLVVKWPIGRPVLTRAFEALEMELHRLEALQDLLDPKASNLQAVPQHERDLAAQYHAALLEGIRYAYMAKDLEPFSWSPYTLTDYVVAGVNLGTYKMGDEKDDLPGETDEPPFALFDNFDIGHMIQGNEGWQDILNYRNKLERPSLSFYVDKVARKRWLPTQGFDQPKLFALHYAHELTDTGNQDDEAAALYNLLPNETGYAAKPTHFSESNGVWLVSHDMESNKTFSSSTVRELLADEKSKFDNWVVAKSLAKSLHGVAQPYESWALKNVKPGVVVEERFADFDQWTHPPLELCIFVIWGRVWVGQMNIVEQQNRYYSAFIYRNGTTAYESPNKEIPYDWLDWPRLVEYAEALGANKDMFRADFFVGIPANSPSYRNGSYQDKVAALRYVASEGEIYPTTTFLADSIPAEAARLWIAGYKKGNYKVVPNTEVPKEYLETGVLSSPTASTE